MATAALAAWILLSKDSLPFVHRNWEHGSPDLPNWQTSWRRLVTDGESAPLTNQSEANQSRAFPALVEPPASVAG